MNASKALGLAQAANIEVAIDGNDLVLSAPAQPPAKILDLLASFKEAIIILLRTGNDGLSSKDWGELFDERAGIGEFDGGLPQDKAEGQAFSYCVSEWLDRNPVRSPVGRCALCGQSKGLLLEYPARRLARVQARTWLHQACSQAWHDGRRAKAVKALSVLLSQTFPENDTLRSGSGWNIE